jgi:hypothetical protein
MGALTASAGNPVAPRDHLARPESWVQRPSSLRAVARNDVDNSQRFRSTPVTIGRHLTGTRLGSAP